MPYGSVFINQVLRFAVTAPVAAFIKATLSESSLTTELKNVRFFVAFSLTHLRVYDK